MPLPDMTEEQIAAATETMNADLLLQLQLCEVSQHLIAVLAKARFTTKMKFQMLGDEAADVGKAAKAMGLGKVGRKTNTTLLYRSARRLARVALQPFIIAMMATQRVCHR